MFLSNMKTRLKKMIIIIQNLLDSLMVNVEMENAQRKRLLKSLDLSNTYFSKFYIDAKANISSYPQQGQ